jgi:hypothetical protein
MNPKLRQSSTVFSTLRFHTGIMPIIDLIHLEWIKFWSARCNPAAPMHIDWAIKRAQISERVQASINSKEKS